MNGLGSIFDMTLYSLQQQSRRLAKLQENIATGSRVVRASDAPADANQILDLQAQGSDMAAYLRNIQSVSSDLQFDDDTMQSITTNVQRVQQLLTQAANSTYSQANREAMAGEIDTILEQTVSLANTQMTGRYLFGGMNVSTAPYAVERSNGSITSVAYQGSQQELSVPVAAGVMHSGMLVGDQLFRNDDAQTPIFSGATGAQAATGTSSVRGDLSLSVTHMATTYMGSSGVRAGASSLGFDTIVGNAHSLTLDMTAKTVSLDGGPATTFTPTDTNLGVTNASGDKVYVDMTHLAPGLVGTVTVAAHATGRLSIDDGATMAVIDFSTNQGVTDAATGKVLFVDGSQITRTGSDSVRVPGTYDMFSAMILARDTLNNTQGLSQTDQAKAIQGCLDAITQVTTGLGRATAIIGGRSQAISQLQQAMENRQQVGSDQQSALEQVDITQVASQLAMTQTFYQMTLNAAAKLMNLSILDYMR